jgi:RNA polymerase sigma factor (sigma-70 family)
MTAGRATVLLQHVRKLAGAEDISSESDRELLQRFAALRDEAAFAALLQRHGPMVLRVCQRVSRHGQDAEDAFQATFLVLARKAASLRWQESIGGWLHEVAHRLAQKAHADTARRSVRERRVQERTSRDVLAEITGRELLSLLDAELTRLPERYRTPLVLCCLEGRTRDEAAKCLGWSVSTVRRRLERGRELLRTRLSSRGVGLPAALAAVLLAEGELPKAVSAELVKTTLDASLHWAAGTTAGVSAQAAVLAKGAMGTMGLTKLKVLAVLATVLGAATAGAGVAFRHSPAARQPEAALMAEMPEPADKETPPETDKKREGVDQYGDPLPPGAVARMGSVRFRMPYESFYATAFSPDGKSLAAIDTAGHVSLWDMSTGRPRHYEKMDLAGTGKPQSKQEVHALVAFSPDGKSLIVGMNRGTWIRPLCLWETETGKEIRRFDGLKEGFVTATVSADFKHLAVLSREKGVTLWDVASGKQLRHWEVEESDVAGLAFAPDGKTLAFGGANKLIYFWDLAGDKEARLFEGHDSPVTALGFSADGKTLASGSTNRRLILWDAGKGKVLREWVAERDDGKNEFESRIFSVAFAPDGKTLATCDRWSTIDLWEVSSGKRLRSFRGTFHQYCSLAPDGKTLAAGGDAYIHLWNVATGEPLYQGHDSQVNGLVFAPDGKKLISTGNSTIHVWQSVSGKHLRTLEMAYSPVLSADGRVAVDRNREGTEVRVAALATGKELRTFKVDHPSSFRELSPDGALLATVYGGDGGDVLALWDLVKGKERCRLGKEGFFGSCVFSPDGKFLATVDMNIDRNGPKPFPKKGDVPLNAASFLRLWDVAAGTRVWEAPILPKLRGVVFSPDGRLLVSSTWDDILVVHEVASGTEVRRWNAQFPWGAPQFPGPYPQWIDSIAISPDGRTLATAGSSKDNGGLLDASLQLWDVDSGRELYQFKMEGRRPTCSLAFSHDGKRLASGGPYDGTIVIWDVARFVARPKPETISLDEKQLNALWKQLGEDVRPAREALLELSRAPKEVPSFVADRLKDLPKRPAEATAARLAKLIAELDDDAFEVREKATNELSAAGERAAAALRKHLAEKEVSPEARKRIERILEVLDAKGRGAPGPVLHWLRVTEVLERLGTPEARKILQKIAAEDSPAADAARAALERLAAKPSGER